jgi:hypothetical protein
VDDGNSAVALCIQLLPHKVLMHLYKGEGEMFFIIFRNIEWFVRTEVSANVLQYIYIYIYIYVGQREF